ncbi:MAG: HAMP domain-containing histidine kinase [Chitinophagaceae bacterium]|nr:MAG: HAMP domain-containing histidine kinase [Chitinophagaceae bacterium]
MRLLQRSLISYIVYSIIIVLIAIPIFYLIINKMFLNDVDEALRQTRGQLVSQLAEADKQTIQRWNDPSGNIKIIPVNKFSEEENIRTISLYDSMTNEKEDFRRLTSVVSINGGYYRMSIRQSLVDSEDLSQGIVTTQIILLTVLLAGLILLTLWQSKKVWKPFYTTLDQLRQFELDKHPAVHLNKTNIREFDELNKAIMQLTDRNNHVYIQQKEFTANAAHELQTPLAAMQAKLELMMQEKNLSEDQVKHIQSLSQSVTRMTRLNKGLLLLAKIENNQFRDVQQIDTGMIIKRVIQQSTSHIQMKHLQVVESYRPTIIHSNPDLTDILITNLINNAILHTPAGGNMEITSGNGKVEIRNSGKPLPFPAENLFYRFQKGNHPKASEGNGLGLAIAKQICNTCHFDIAYRYEDGYHVFTLRFQNHG